MLVLLLSPPFLSICSIPHEKHEITWGNAPLRNGFIDQDLRTLLPIYVRLQTLEESNVTFWESVPQDFTGHVGTIEVDVLALFISSNALSFDLSRDAVGNLWITTNQTMEEGEYMSTLTWVSSKTINENLTIPDFIPFPPSYPEGVKIFLDPGRKMSVDDPIIKEIAVALKTPNIIDTVENVLDLVTENQEYDSEKTRLLMSGSLNTTKILDFFKGPLEVLETGSSICIERSLCAVAILRAAGVPTRTFTDVRLKTWIQVWLPGYGWVDAEALCVEPPPLFPRPLSSTTPWMIENSSDALFPFMWLPDVPMRVVNLTFSNVDAFNVNNYGTILSQPIDAGMFEEDPAKFSFPILIKPEIIYAAITSDGSNLSVSLTKDEEEVSKTLTLGETNSVTLGDVNIKFKPVWLGDFLVLQDFVVQATRALDLIVLIPIIVAPVILAVWLYLRRKH